MTIKSIKAVKKNIDVEFFGLLILVSMSNERGSQRNSAVKKYIDYAL